MAEVITHSLFSEFEIYLRRGNTIVFTRSLAPIQLL
jgi:hypothetical protein